MSLPPLSLDDLTFEDLRLMAVRRIPAASAARWTHHEPVDPGITLLELFAFLLDQQVFMLDQVSDAMLLALLNLLGEAPRGAVCARTVLAPEPGQQAGFAMLNAGDPLRPVDAGLASLVYSPRDASLVPPVASLAIDTGGARHECPLLQPVALAKGAGAPAAFSIRVDLAQAFDATHTGMDLAFAIILDDCPVVPEWSHRAVEVPAPAKWNLALESASGRTELANWFDGTGGLRRSGLVRFKVPSDLEGESAFMLHLETDAAHHTAPVLAASVACGAMITEHRWQRTFGPETNGDSEHDAVLAALSTQVADWLPISAMGLQLPDILGSVLVEDLRLELEHTREGWQTWEPVADLFASTSQDRQFTVDRELGQLAFGDGYQGRVPAPANRVRLQASFGGGAAGHHPAGLKWEDNARAGLVALTSIVEASEGREPETIDETRVRAAASLLERERAVTVEDFVTLVENADGIAPHRAFVAPGHDPSFPCLTIDDSLTVFVVPHSQAEIPAPQADEGALAWIEAMLDEARLLTTRVFVRRPILRPVMLTLTVSGDEIGGARHYRELIEPVLRTYLHPTLGGPARAGWGAGQALRPSELLRVAQSALSAGSRVESVAIALEDTDAAASDCGEVPIGDYELVQLVSLKITVVSPTAREAVL